MMLETKRQQRIVSAAIKTVDGTIICSPRHFDGTIHQLTTTYTIPFGDLRKGEQGFVDNFGEFFTRQEAWKIAGEADQILYRVGGDDYKGGTLYSENLY